MQYHQYYCNLLVAIEECSEIILVHQSLQYSIILKLMWSTVIYLYQSHTCRIFCRWIIKVTVTVACCT